jgi:simple sugar transport system substrate-binding protein
VCAEFEAKTLHNANKQTVVTLGPSLGVAVQQQLEQDGSTAKVVTYAFNNDLIPLLQNGKVAFTIDQQPYLQGYLSIDSLWLYHKNKSVIGAQQSVPTGPVVIDQNNIGDIVDEVKAGLR